MTTKQIEMIRSSWAIVSAIDPETVGSLFYGRLFTVAPQVRPMFRGSISEQSKKLLTMLNYIIVKLDRLDELKDDIAKLARSHAGYGVTELHYTVVGEVLLRTLEQGLGDQWNNDLKEAWTVCYTILSSAMINAAQYAKQNAA